MARSSFLLLAFAALLAVPHAAGAQTAAPVAPAGFPAGYLIVRPDPGASGTDGEATLGVSLHSGQLIHLCPGRPHSPSSGKAPTARPGSPEAQGIVAQMGLCKRNLGQSGPPTVATASTREIEPDAELLLIPAAAVLAQDARFDLLAAAIPARVIVTREAARGRHALLEPADASSNAARRSHFVHDGKGRFLGIGFAVERDGRPHHLLLPHEALSGKPQELLHADMSSSDLAAMAEALERELIHSRLPALVRRARDHARAGDVDAAIAAYRRAASIRPDAPEVDRDLGVLLLQQAAYSDAAGHLERAITLDRDDKSAWNALGVAYQKLMRYRDASAAFDRALALDGRFYGAWLNLAVLAHEQGDHGRAHAAYERAAELDPASPVPWFGKGLVHAQTGDLAGEIDAYRKALAIDPDYPKALYNLGKAYLLAGLVADAVTTYERLVSSHPAHVDALFNLGLAYFLDRRQDEVARIHMRIRAISRPDAEIFYLRFLAPLPGGTPRDAARDPLPAG